MNKEKNAVDSKDLAFLAVDIETHPEGQEEQKLFDDCPADNGPRFLELTV